MSIATQISRIESDRNKIRDKLVELGMATATDKLDVLAEAIENMENQGAVSATVKEGETYTIPAGYHNGSGTVSGVKGGGNYTLQSKTATPTKKQQSITPDSGYYGMSDVMVAPIPDAYQNVSSVTAGAADVLAGKVFVQKDGTVTAGAMVNHGNVEKYIDVTPNNQGYRIPQGYHTGQGVVAVKVETKSVTPSKSTQTITPTDGKVLSQVTVDPIPATYQDTSGVTAAAGDVLSGKKYVASDGSVVTGTMTDRGSIAVTIDGLTVTSYTIPAGKHSGSGTVSLTGDIETALAAI